MKTNTVLGIAIAAAFSMIPVATFAQSTSTLTRADVLAQVQAARADGTLMPAGEGWGPENTPQADSHASTAKSRAEVKAETRAATEAGILPIVGERSFMDQPSTTSKVSRAAVKAETLKAVRDGTIGGASYHPGGPQH